MCIRDSLLAGYANLFVLGAVALGNLFVSGEISVSGVCWRLGGVLVVVSVSSLLISRRFPPTERWQEEDLRLISEVTFLGVVVAFIVSPLFSIFVR